jgi:1-acyl-sn-glycerol-3-phosphate acyltransferase
MYILAGHLVWMYVVQYIVGSRIYDVHLLAHRMLD